MLQTQQFSIETCFSPKLFSEIQSLSQDSIIVVTDVLRATTSICAALQYKVREIIPVASKEIALQIKGPEDLIASETNGIKDNFADLGNSALDFMNEGYAGKRIIYHTTNGTKTILLAQTQSSNVVIGALVNARALAEWLKQQEKDVIILCSAWKNKFCLEDSLFAGVLSQYLMEDPRFYTHCDSTLAAQILWKEASKDLMDFIKNISHYHRLNKAGITQVYPYTFTLDTVSVIPIVDGDRIIDLKTL